MPVNISNLKKQLMERINSDDLVQVEKVERYIELVKTFNRINKIVSSEGESVVTTNASQTFTKAHPLIGERNKISAALLNIEKSFEFKLSNNEKESYNVDDLT